MKLKFIIYLNLLSIALIAQNELPLYFDLRDYNGSNQVTSIKNQDGGTCWAYSVIGSIESNLLFSGIWENSGEMEEPNLAEYHMDWWNGFNTHYNADQVSSTVTGREVHNGASFAMATAYISRFGGVVRDIDAQSYSKPPKIDDANYKKFYPRHIEKYYIGENLENIDSIKHKLMNQGGLSIAYAYDESFLENNIHYQPAEDEMLVNHCVLIIGWNDTIVTQADEPGAWIVKNSWGDDWGNNGYFYISYYDKQVGHNIEYSTVSFKDVELFKYNNIYYHDYHGFRDTLKNTNETFNAFTATANETLSAVSFHTSSNNVDFEIIIYDDFSNNILSNPLSTITGNFYHIGYHTVDLATTVNLEKGDDFYIYLKLSDGKQAYDCTSDAAIFIPELSNIIVSSYAERDQSFYYHNGQWADLYDYDTTANFCIKGYTLKNNLTPSKATIPSGNITYCNNNADLIFKSYSDGAEEYHWSLIPENVGTVSSNNNEAYITINNDYEGFVKLYVYGSNNEGDGALSDPINIQKKTLNAPVKIELGEDRIECKYESLNLFTPISWLHYSWNNQENFTSSNYLKVLSPGEYFVYQLDYKFGCIGISDTIYIDTYQVPEYDIGNDTTITIEDSVKLEINSNFENILWSNGETTNEIMVYGSELGIGEHYFTVTFDETENNCTLSDTVLIRVEPVQVINRLENNEIYIFPNPTRNKIQITSKEIINSIQIISLNGVLFDSKNSINQYKYSIDLSDLNPGIYILQIMSNQKTIKRKLVKQ